MKIRRLFVLLWPPSLLVCCGMGCCDPPPTMTLPVSLLPQETSMWCWAASGEMCMEFFGANITQCDQANQRFGRTDCCGTPVPAGCVVGGWPEFNKYGFTASNTSDAALSWKQITKQIFCKKKPFAFTWHWTGDGGHMMVARGYRTVDGVNWIERNNPLPVSVGTTDFITYDNYVSGSDHTHWDDYYDITKR